MKKRLRKKRHLGEFRQFGFSVEAIFRENLSADEFEGFSEAFVVDAIEANGLSFGGGGSPEIHWSGVVQRNHRYESVSDVDLTAVAGWLRTRTEVASFRVSSMWDVWHGSDPFDRGPDCPV